MEHTTQYDVVICGGGLAGLTLARQLVRELAPISVLVLEKQSFPVSVACHKVGESTVEGAAHYFSQVLGLKSYLERSHLPKFGLRFFLGDSTSPLDQRVEQGAADQLPVPSYQLDRGILENDLCQMNRDMGVEIREGCIIRDIELSADGPHRVIYTEKGAGDQLHSVQARWLVDTSGRARLLQTKLGLRKPAHHHASACWWRVRGEHDVSAMVPPSDAAWHQRVGNNRRWLSTNHLTGTGYWVWLIPLASGHTSIGIVSDENQHPIRERNSYIKALRWLEQHEPRLAELLRDTEPVDFKAFKDFAYLTPQAYSHERWSCVGEAAAFLDPLYSTGSDFIAWGNIITTKLIRLDRRGELTAERVALHNEVLTRLLELGVLYYRDMYSVFGTPQVMLRKIVWDTAMYWLMFANPLAHRLVDDDIALRAYCSMLQRIHGLHERVQTLFRDWANMAPKTGWSGFHPLNHLRFAIDAYLLLETTQMPAQVLGYLHEGISRCEELAQVLFFDAVRELMPEALAKQPGPPWVNPYAISLRPERWQEDGLFEPAVPARDLSAMTAELELTVLSPAEKRARLAALLHGTLSASMPAPAQMPEAGAHPA